MSDIRDLAHELLTRQGFDPLDCPDDTWAAAVLEAEQTLRLAAFAEHAQRTSTAYVVAGPNCYVAHARRDCDAVAGLVTRKATVYDWLRPGPRPPLRACPTCWGAGQ